MSLANTFRFSTKIRIVLACVNATISLATLLFSGEFSAVRNVVWVSFSIFIALLASRFENILFFGRTLFLGGIGYFPMLIKVLNGPTALFSGLERSTQGFQIVVVMYVATSLGLLGNEVGLALGSSRDPVVPAPDSEYEISLWRLTFILCIPIMIWASAETAKHGGESVFVAAYASDSSNELPLGNTIAIGIICLLAMWVATIKKRAPYDLPIFYSLAVYFVVYAMFLRGVRMDVLTPLLGLMVCFGLCRREAFPITIKYFLVSVGLYAIFEIWGVARQMLASTGVDLTLFTDVVIQNSTNSSDAIRFGTVSPIATTFSNMVWLIDSKTLPLAWGKSYWEFILRTPPEFMYPGRPIDYAWIFEKYDLLAAGGFFELAEAYMNLGLWGALIFPGIISYLLAKSFFYTLHRQTVFSYFLLFSFLGVFFRGTWYQTFAFYKAFTTIVILYFGFYFVHRAIRGGRSAFLRASS